MADGEWEIDTASQVNEYGGWERERRSQLEIH
jgi:hypothetical protein